MVVDSLQSNTDCSVCNQCLLPDSPLDGVTASPPLAVGRAGILSPILQQKKEVICSERLRERSNLPRNAPLAHGRAGPESQIPVTGHLGSLKTQWVASASFLEGHWTLPSWSLTHLCSRPSLATCCGVPGAATWGLLEVRALPVGEI